MGPGEGLDEIEFHEKIWGLNPRSFGVKMATLLILTWSIANSGNSGYGRAGGSVVKRGRGVEGHSLGVWIFLLSMPSLPIPVPKPFSRCV